TCSAITLPPPPSPTTSPPPTPSPPPPSTTSTPPTTAVTTTTSTTSTTTTTAGTTTTSTSSTTTTTSASVGGTFLEFTTGVPGGVCGNILNATNGLIRNLTCGGLNLGGGGSTVGEGPTPDGSASLFALSCAAGGACDNNCAGSICNVGPVAGPPPVNSAFPDCTTTGCNFGTPLPIANFNQAVLTTCALNTLASPATGTVNIGSGASQTSLPLSSDVFLTGLPNQPCPKCLPLGAPPFTGTCDRGPRAGSPCTSTSATGYSRDCVTGGVGTLASPCPGGQQPANGQSCC